jgi:hypothetical protein
MKYFIGQVAAEDIRDFGVDGLFEYGGDYYYNVIEFGTNAGGMEDFVISDTAGRSIPLSTEHISTLIEILTDIQESLEAIETGKNTQEFINSNEIRIFEW